jgi:glutathione peroxidase-family protein
LLHVWHVWLLQEKVEVNGPSTHPVWKYLKSACPTCDGEVTWNFKVRQMENFTPEYV